MTEKDNINNPHLKSNSFSVPDGYFESLNNRISSEVFKRDSSSGRGILSLSRVLRPGIAIAITFSALFILSYGSLNILTPASHCSEKRMIREISRMVEDGYFPKLYSNYAEYEIDDNSVSSSQQEINPDQIVEFLKNDNINIMALTLSNE